MPQRSERVSWPWLLTLGSRQRRGPCPKFRNGGGRGCEASCDFGGGPTWYAVHQSVRCVCLTMRAVVRCFCFSCLGVEWNATRLPCPQKPRTSGASRGKHGAMKSAFVGGGILEDHDVNRKNCVEGGCTGHLPSPPPNDWSCGTTSTGRVASTTEPLQSVPPRCHVRKHPSPTWQP